jgi:magnesium transporter
MRKAPIRYAAPGSSPGHAIESVEADARDARVHWIRYNESEIEQEEDAFAGDVLEGLAPHKVDWLHFDHVPGPKTLRWLKERLGLDALALEDVHNGNQRTKLERFDSHSFLVVNVPVMQDGQVVLEQFSLFLGPHWIISIWPGPPGVVEPVRHRLRGGLGRLRKRAVDYLFYTLVDAAVDSAFPVLEAMRLEVEELEESLLEGPSDAALDRVRRSQRNIITLRRLNIPGRETFGQLAREEDSPLTAQTRRYMRDVLDHHMRIGDMIDSLSELARSMHELYLSTLSHRMNDVMKLLTMIATIFIPLSFFTGLYGMNFNTEISPWNMPELNSRYGYPILLLLLATVAGLMIWLFRRRDWL